MLQQPKLQKWASNSVTNLDIPINRILHGNCIEVMKTFPDECIDMAMFSPPYWWVKDFGTGTHAIYDGKADCQHEFDKESFCSKCGAWYGKLGLEPTPKLHIKHIVDICIEIRRILKKEGNLYLNIGDAYGTHSETNRPRNGFSEKFVMEKNLLLMPSRVAIALQDDGWILRNDIIWHRSSKRPTGSKDRLTKTHDHIFHFVKSKKYYYDLDAIREEHKFGIKIDNPKGKNPGDVWNIKAKPIREGHLATYPEDICIIPIKASCPPDGIVLDPMCGVGTTCVVAKRLHRKFVGIEIDPKSAEKATKRLSWIPTQIHPHERGCVYG